MVAQINGHGTDPDLTLGREEIAAMAMQGLAASDPGVWSQPGQIVERAFQIADAFLAQANRNAAIEALAAFLNIVDTSRGVEIGNDLTKPWSDFGGLIATAKVVVAEAGGVA